MTKHYKNKIYIALLGVTLAAMPIWSCTKFVTLPLPSTQVPSEAMYTNETSLTSGLNGLYSSLASTANGSTYGFTYPSLFSDELVAKSTSYDAAQKNQYTPANDYGFFAAYYKTIYQANAIIADLDKATTVPKATVSQVEGECLFVRAFCYFQLVNYYGGVPLYTNTDVKVNAVLPAAPAADVYKQIITDLNAAVPLMAEDYAPLTYTTPPAEIPQRTRANRQTANALLARVYLYTKDYPKAISAATAVINSPLYSLGNDLNTVFLSTSNETIWQFWNQYGTALSYVPSNTANAFSYTVKADLANAFEAGDGRKAAWLKAGTGGQSANYYVYKWKSAGTSGNLEYVILFRLAEMYLVRAEALAQTNDVSNGLADVYTIRKRAGLLTPISGVTTKDQLLDLVASERRKELSFENGHRWFDLNRTGKTITVLSPSKPGIDEHIMLLPFPQAIINTNPYLVQNPGYTH